MDDEIWTMRDGTKIKVGDMTESHARNTLRMIIRNERRRAERALLEKMTDSECFEPLDTPTNDVLVARLERQHGVRIICNSSVAGMSGADVYTEDGRHLGWYGGIR